MMRKQNPDQLSLNLPAPAESSGVVDVEVTASVTAEERHVAKVYRFETAQKVKTEIEEQKYVKAIIELVRHYD